MFRTQNLQQFRPRDNEPDDRQKSPYDFPRIIRECGNENKIIGEELDRRLKLQHLQREKEVVKARYDYITEPRKKLSDTVDENALKEQSMKFTMSRTMPKYNMNNEQVYNFDNERKENNYNNNMNNQYNNNNYNNTMNSNYNQENRMNYQTNNFNNSQKFEQNKNFENNFFYKSSRRDQPLYQQSIRNLDIPPSPNQNINNNSIPNDYNNNNNNNQINNLSRSQSFPTRNQKFDDYYYDNNYDQTFDNKNKRFIQTPYKIEYHQRHNHFNNPNSSIPDYMLYDDLNINKTRPYYFYEKDNIQYRKYSPYIYDYERSRFGDQTYNYYLNEAMRSDISKDWKYPPQYYYLPRFNPKTHTYENNY